MTTGWYSAKRGGPAGGQPGPFTWEELFAQARDGALNADDLVWNPQLPQWTPAGQIPGLMPASAPPPLPGSASTGGGYTGVSIEPRTKRHASWLLPVLIPAIALIIAGVGLGVYFGAFYGHGRESTAVGGDASTANAGQSVAAGEIKTEKLHLAGRVALPPGSSLSPTDLAILSNTSDASCSSDGRFAVEALHDEGARTAILVLNQARKPVLMAMADSSKKDMQPSVASTARMLVLYDPAFLSLPKAAYDLAATRLETQPRLPALEAALSDAITQDASHPLDADAHPDIYNIAAEIAASLLSGISQTGEAPAGPGSAPLLLASTNPMTGMVPSNTSPSVIQLAATNPDPFVYVADDENHTTTEVKLVNTTFAFYDVTSTLTTPQGPSVQTYFLPRCALWRLALSYVPINPLTGCKLEKLVDVGDGQLAFSFERDNAYTGLDICANLATLLLGAGGESIRKILPNGTVARGGRAFAATGNTGGALLKATEELSQLGDRLQGQTYPNCVKEVGAFLATNGVRLALAFKPYLEQDLKEEFLTVAGYVITRRMAALAVLGYGSADLTGEIMAYRDPAIVSFQTEGVQLGGIYPFGVTLKLRATPRDARTYSFNAVVGDLPGSFDQPLYLEVDFGDGNKETVQPQAEGGFAPIGFDHTYVGTVPKTVRAVLRTASGGTSTVIATKEVDLTSATTSTTATTATSTATSTTAGTTARGSGQSGRQELNGMVFEWSISGADVGDLTRGEASGTITSSTVRISGKMSAGVTPGAYTESSMSAYIVVSGGTPQEVKWHGELSDAKGLTHELPFDLSVDVPAGATVQMAASVNMVGGVADVLGIYVGLR